MILQHVRYDNTYYCYVSLHCIGNIILAFNALAISYFITLHNNIAYHNTAQVHNITYVQEMYYYKVYYIYHYIVFYDTSYTCKSWYIACDLS